MYVPVVVIGGGISGLAAAHRLVERLGPASMLLVDAAPRLGGKIRTEHRDGFVLEAGPDCFLASKPGGVELCRRLGLGDRLVGTRPSLRRSYVKRNGRLHPLPEGITGLVPSRLLPLLTTGILSPLGRARAGLEMLVPPRRAPGEESVAAFARRRFGAEAYDWLIEPLLSGIFAGDGETLSLDSAFPQLKATERRDGSLLRPLLAARMRRHGRLQPGFVTLPGGLGELVDAVTSRLPAAGILTGAPVKAVVPGDGGPRYRVLLSDGRELQTEAVVLATPAFAAAEVLEQSDPALTDALREIAFVSTVTVTLAFPEREVPAPLSGYGYVCPRREGGAIVACSWTSNKFAGRVPPGMVLVRFFIGRAGREELVGASDAILVSHAREELRSMHGVTATPVLTRVARWTRGMPQYTLGHADRLARIDRVVAAHRGLALAGASYRGVGIPDCIASGWDAAESVIPLVESAATVAGGSA